MIFLLALFGGRLGVPPVVLIAGGAVAVAAFNAVFRRRIGAAARRNLELDAADQPFAVDIAAAVVAWHHPAQPAPPFVRHVPATAT